MVEESAVLARSVLAVADMEAAPQIRRGDDQIDILYHELENNCTQLLTAKVLPQQQVKEVLSYIHCVRDLERIGDYCKECFLPNHYRSGMPFLRCLIAAAPCWP